MNLTAQNKTMTSVEIAEMTGKRHDNILRDIELLVAGISSDLSRGFKSSTYKDLQQRDQPCYVMDEDSTLLLVTGYDATARMKVIKRWKELEAKHTPLTYKEALYKLIEAEEERERMLLVITDQSEQISEDAILTEKSPEYYTVKQLRSLVQKPSGVVLSRVSAAMNYDVKSVYSQYDKMASNQYHKDVVNAVYGTDL